MARVECQTQNVLCPLLNGFLSQPMSIQNFILPECHPEKKPLSLLQSLGSGPLNAISFSPLLSALGSAPP